MNNPTELCKIMMEEGSDKGSIEIGHHNYTLEYYSLFGPIRNKVKNVFELGLGTNYTDVKSSMGPNGKPGASLRGWKKFFPNANIVGADIDKRILFIEDRITTYFVDQTNSNLIADLWNNEDIKNTKFDIMVDDGLHELSANMIFLENSFHKLNDDGIYIIEDVFITNIPEFDKELKSLKQKLNFHYLIKNIPHEKNKMDNCLVIITHDKKYDGG